MDGILPVDKPVGLSSYDVVRRIKRTLPRGHKVGHAGTLDPFASGVLLILLGGATKRFDEIQKWKKTYLATARLGYKSDTLDSTGVIGKGRVAKMTPAQVRQVMARFVGEISQEIPAYSAAKVAGQPRYKFARRGEFIPQKIKTVQIYSLDLLDFDNAGYDSEVQMRVTCGSGTYIRQLSSDIFRSLSTDSYLTQLRREAVGEITIDDCLSSKNLSATRVSPSLISPLLII